MCPASVLQLHPHVTVVIDSAAAAELALSSYYLRARAHEVALLEGASL
jgi:glucosamine-6-phosphate deaminase